MAMPDTTIERTQIDDDPSALSDKTIESVAHAVNSLARPFAETYEKLNYPGYVSVLGAILVLPL
jgi:hypothetical protein